jgi:hypothetical protein
MMMIYEKNGEVNSLGDFPIQRPNSSQLHLRFDWHKDLALSVPRLNDHYKYAIDEQRILLTLILFNACARYRIPSTPIRFPVRSSVVTVLVK